MAGVQDVRPRGQRAAGARRAHPGNSPEAASTPGTARVPQRGRPLRAVRAWRLTPFTVLQQTEERSGKTGNSESAPFLQRSHPLGAVRDAW